MTIKPTNEQECPCLEPQQCVFCQDLTVIPQFNLETIRLKAIDNKLRNQRTLLLEKLCSIEIAIELNQKLLEKNQQ